MRTLETLNGIDAHMCEIGGGGERRIALHISGKIQESAVLATSE